MFKKKIFNILNYFPFSYFFFCSLKGNASLYPLDYESDGSDTMLHKPLHCQLRTAQKATVG